MCANKEITPSLNPSVHSLVSVILKNEYQANTRISLVSSENVLSPLARIPYLLDIHSRYYLDDIRRFGKWLFPNGEVVENIEDVYLVPLLKELTEASYVNVRPISGMNCMTVALAALTKIGDTVLAVPLENGGHFSTSVIAERFGLNVTYIPFMNAYDVDYDALELILKEKKPALIYVDHSVFLFPLNPKPIRELIDAFSPETILYYDTSHTNGLIIGKALENPLNNGADIIGGSTHKTLPGPHKGFLSTNNQVLDKIIKEKANHFVSHHNPASSLSLAITLMEMKYCQGTKYAKTIISNSKTLAKTLDQQGFYVAAKERDYTQNHQIWAYPNQHYNIEDYIKKLCTLGIVTNRFDALPGIHQPAFRLSLAEFTRYGGTNEDAILLGELMSDVLHLDHLNNQAHDKMKYLKNKIKYPQYCFSYEDISANDEFSDLKNLFTVLKDLMSTIN